MHAHGTSSVSHPGSFLKTLGGVRVDHELVRSGWQLSTVHDGRLSAVQGSRARSGVKIEDCEEHEEEHEGEHEEEWWSTRNVRRSARNVSRTHIPHSPSQQYNHREECEQEHKEHEQECKECEQEHKECEQEHKECEQEHKEHEEHEEEHKECEQDSH